VKLKVLRSFDSENLFLEIKAIDSFTIGRDISNNLTF